MVERSICVQTEHETKVSPCDQINMQQSLKQSRQFGIIVTQFGIIVRLQAKH